MPRPLSMDLRRRVIALYHEGKLTQDAVAAHFNVGVASVKRWLALERATGSLEPRPTGGDNSSLLDESAMETVRILVEHYPSATLPELVDRFVEQGGIPVSRATMGRVVRRLGFTRKKSRLSQ